MACCFNLEYLLVGGRDARRDDRPFFMWYDWMAGGWGGRQGRDGQDCTSPVFGVGLAVQPLEGQERPHPGPHFRSRDHPGLRRARARIRGGCRCAQGRDAHAGRGCRHVLLLRPRTQRHLGHRRGAAVDPTRRVAASRDRRRARFLGANFSGVPVAEGDVFEAPAAPAVVASAIRSSATRRRCSRTSRTAT